MRTRRLLVLHENAESVPARFLALPDDVEVHLYRVCNPVWAWRVARRHSSSGFAWGHLRGDERQRTAVVPGLRRFTRASGAALRRTYRRFEQRFGTPDAVVFDSPYLLGGLPAVEAPLRVYLAPDPFAYYAWDRDTTASLEREMLARCDVSFAVSRALLEDFRSETTRPVHHLPNAVPRWLVDEIAAGPEVPAELRQLPRPIVGCIGKINATYDWELLDRMAEALPDASFVFVGPVIEPRGAARDAIMRCFDRPNVHWLGARPYASLPAYLEAFDVCLNPLRVDAHNDRRSPLRLYEYMASSRPIVSTMLGELDEFEGHVRAIEGPEHAAALLRQVLGQPDAVDRSARREWVARNTWEARGCEFLDAVVASEPRRAA